MNFYTNAFRKGNSIYVRKIENGCRVVDCVDYKPTLFVTPKTNTKTEWRDFYGNPIEPLLPGSMSDSKEFIDKYHGVSGFNVYGGDIQYVYQYLNNEYPNDIDYNFDKIVTYTIDIETATESGFPKVETANEQILLITIKILNDNSVEVFTFNSYENPNVNVRVCANEVDMLRRFIQFMGEHTPDIITGWNIEAFDIPYIINRITNLLGKKEAAKLSPWKSIQESEKKTKFGKTIQAYSIGGIAILDYLNLYRKFTYVIRENYKLDHIAYVELGEKKLDHSEYATFKDFYSNDWNKFVNYNIRDTELVHNLEKKLKLIELATTLAYMSKTNYEDVFSPVRLWDSIIHNYLWNQKICIPNKSTSTKDAPYEGAYVKDPIVGLHNWIVSFDATSLYPSIIQTWNISPETLVDVDNTREVPIEWYLRGEQEIPNDGNSHCINGAVFTKEKQGVFVSTIDFYMDLRKSTKKLMLQKKQEAQILKDSNKDKSKEYKDLKNEIAYLDVKQLAVKILLNSLYGSLGTPYFRYYNIDMARAITMNGQFIIRSVGEAIDRELNKKLKTENVKYLIYADTDSIGPDDLVYANGQQIRIKDLYNTFSAYEYKDDFNRNYVKPVKDVITKSFNTSNKTVEDKSIKYVMKHRVCKEMFKITIGDKSVTVTEDHSVIVYRNGRFISVKPRDILQTDKMIKIINN
jgi:DNA polymerase elongation subunit (family B)